MSSHRFLFVSYILFFLLTSSSAFAKNPYPNVGVCDGLPKIDLNTSKDSCVGIVSSDLKMPRGVLPMSDTEIFITEMGSWEKNHGRLSRLTLQNNGHFVRSTVFDGLDRPHAIVQGADGWVYVGEAGRVFRFDPKASKAVAEVVLTNLPNDGLHPLKQMLFDAGGNLYLSMGAKTDHCESKGGMAVGYPCKEKLGERATASIWKVTSLNHQSKMTVYARGLRNTMGMVWSPFSDLIVTENGRDNIARTDKKLSDEKLPHDELNVVKPGGDYGWPYCYDDNKINPEYRAWTYICRKSIEPSFLLPAHSAPLGILLYPKNGEIRALRGEYLIALHGYRGTGHRIVSMKKNAMGLPSGALYDVIDNWGATDSQPMGAPVDLRTSPSGKLYITDDRNGMLLRLSESKDERKK